MKQHLTKTWLKLTFLNIFRWFICQTSYIELSKDIRLSVKSHSLRNWMGWVFGNPTNVFTKPRNSFLLRWSDINYIQTWTYYSFILQFRCRSTLKSHSHVSKYSALCQASSWWNSPSNSSILSFFIVWNSFSQLCRSVSAPRDYSVSPIIILC